MIKRRKFLALLCLLLCALILTSCNRSMLSVTGGNLDAAPPTGEFRLHLWNANGTYAFDPARMNETSEVRLREDDTCYATITPKNGGDVIVIPWSAMRMNHTHFTDQVGIAKPEQYWAEIFIPYHDLPAGTYTLGISNLVFEHWRDGKFLGDEKLDVESPIMVTENGGDFTVVAPPIPPTTGDGAAPALWLALAALSLGAACLLLFKRKRA